MRIYCTHDEIKQRWPYIVAGVEEPSHRHFAFRPPRPANILVTLDRVTGEINVSAGTIGPLTWDPYTIVIHCSKSSLDSSANIQQVGAECVVALPGTDIITETWITALNLPRGVNEGRVARFTFYPSRLVKAPSIAECPVNFECVIEQFREQHSHYIAFLRVLGASVDESLLTEHADAAQQRFPTWEVDDVDNPWGGSVERLGVLGEFLDAPRVRAARGWGGHFEDWLVDLQQTGELSLAEFATAGRWLARWAEVANMRPAGWGGDEPAVSTAQEMPERAALQAQVTRLCELIAWNELEQLHALLASA
jgi:flavin reductase (DIM6/NTAB) family NADH-FMN oxidoreductase RutF